MKKLFIFFLTLLLSISLYAVDFPSYDFTFYNTSDETLTSLNKNNVGIDVTGYGFIGKESRNGIYLRIGIQTPFDTLLKLKDELFSSTEENTGEETITPDSSSTTTVNPALITSTTTLPSSTEDTTAAVDSTDTSSSTESSITSQDGSSSAILAGDTTAVKTEEKSTNNKTVDTTKWKFLLSIGPAYRSTMGENALVYSGVGFSFSTEFTSTFNSDSKYYNSSFSSMFSLDLDAGFRVGLIYSKTTIRIGVHAISHLIGYTENKTYLKDNDNPTTTRNFYCYFAGEDGLINATVLKGYIRLATTFSDKTKTTYNYSNTTPFVGKGVITEVDSN